MISLARFPSIGNAFGRGVLCLLCFHQQNYLDSMGSLYDEKLSARHVTDSAQRILNLIPLRSGDRGLHVVDDDSFVMLALWSLLRWERRRRSRIETGCRPRTFG